FFRPQSVAHPAPHSFPTRRSSDLRWLPAAAALHDMSGERANDQPQRTRRIDRGVACADADGGGEGVVSVASSDGGAGERGHEGADRKSTRLNSSHQIISYAVFCLK